MTTTSNPSESQLAKLRSLPLDSPVAVLNLFQFNAQAQYQPEDPEFNTAAANVTGAEAFKTYGKTARKFITDVGGKVVFNTPIDQVLIGPTDTQWDIAAIMYFPTRKDFIEMLADPVFKKVSRHRKAALANHYMIHLNGDPFKE